MKVMTQVLETPSLQAVDFEFNAIVVGMMIRAYADAPQGSTKCPIRWWGADIPARDVVFEGRRYIVNNERLGQEMGVGITVKPEDGPGKHEHYWIPYSELDKMHLSLKAVVR